MDEEDAVLTAEAWWIARQSRGAAVREGVRRRYGRGRRPAQKELANLSQRAALSVRTLHGLVDRLEPPKQRRQLLSALRGGDR